MKNTILCFIVAAGFAAGFSNSFGSVISGNDPLNSSIYDLYKNDPQGIQINKHADEVLMKQFSKAKPLFETAYNLYPEVPRGILEAVAYHYTHFRHITSGTPESCSGMPRVFGVMGLTLDGKNYFRNNLVMISELSGYSIDEIIDDPEKNVIAFASAFTALKNQMNISGNSPSDMLNILIALSELNIKQETSVNDYTMNLYLYGIISFLNDHAFQEKFDLPEYSFNMEEIFGENLSIYRASKVTLSEGMVTSENGQIYKPTGVKTACPDYNFSNCLWVASPNHYTGWYETPYAVAIHTVQGSYTSCVNWFQNPSASASTHYVVASNSVNAGKITQMVDESNEAWHIGSQNGKAFGYEHEGFVDDASWYTSTMYQISADLTRDVCNDNGIDPLRTGFWPWMAATDYDVAGIPGTCCTVKGHQHFPSQSHTDPGINWDWDYYYKLINNNPTVNTLTATTGNLYDSGGASGDYTNDERMVWVISPAGATSVTLNFSAFSVENTWDYIYIYDGNSVWSNLIGYYTGTTSPGTITSTGGAITVEFRSDCATVGTGWAASWTSSAATNVPANLTATALGCPDNNVQFSWQNSGSGWYILLSESPSYTSPYIKWVSGLTSYTGPAGFVLQSDGVTPLVLNTSTTYYWKIWNSSLFTDGPTFTTLNCDNIVPTTSISTPGNWKTTDFTATFSDSDNSTVEKAFYQVLDFDGTYWSANADNGFFGDNFDILQPVWTDSAGNWSVSSGTLVQSDESVNNSNIFAPLNQNLSNRYLYHFTAKAEGSGTNRRFGFHLFCDDGSQSNRGNSYFVWFRIEGQTMEFFKCTNNSFTAASKIVSGVTTTPGQYYDFKITYDRILGTISVWRDNIYMGSWTDPAPLSTNGNYISFRSGNCILTVNEIKVFRSRYPTADITLGDNTSDIRCQNPSPSTYGAKIKSIIVDGNFNLSDIAFHDLNVDWTPPTDPQLLNDGTSADIDTSWTLTELSANWEAGTDVNSGIAAYWYAIGTTSGGNDIVDWTNNGSSTNITHSGLSLTDQQVYYVSVKTENGAGLFSNVISSNGQVAALNVSAQYTGIENSYAYPNPTNGLLNITCSKEIFNLCIIDNSGRIVHEIKNISSNTYSVDLSSLSISSGSYTLKLSDNKSEKIIPFVYNK